MSDVAYHINPDFLSDPGPGRGRVVKTDQGPDGLVFSLLYGDNGEPVTEFVVTCTCCGNGETRDIVLSWDEAVARGVVIIDA